MSGIDLAHLTLTEASALIERREVSPLDLTEACIARGAKLEPLLHAYLTTTFDSAVEEARRATEEIAAGKRRGALHGVPFALKDLYETAGVRTTAGSQVRENHVPAADAHVVTRLKEAGVVMLGKLNLHEFALGGTNIQTYFETPRNPWDTTRITGGSSGGSGAAIAAGLCLGSLGSDTRGSIRIPAALCGITGLKPTYGRVSLRGVVPLAWSLDHAGPMARSASDCALILQAIAGFDAEDPTSADVAVADYVGPLQAGLNGVRVGVPNNFFFDETIVDAVIAAAVHAAEAVFRGLGASVQPVDFPDPNRFTDDGAFLAEAAAYHEPNLRDHPGLYGEQVRERLENAMKNTTGAAYSRGRYRQLEFKSALKDLFRSVDLVLTPTSPMVAPRIDKAGRMPGTILLHNTSPFNTTGTPAISVGCGFSDEGLPIGLQIAGRAWEEGLVLRAAHAYQGATEWHRRAPAVA